MQQRNTGNRRPSGTDGSDFSFRMVVDNRYTKVAKGKSTLTKIILIQAVLLLVGVLDILFTFFKKESVAEILVVASTFITFISLVFGELGRKRSRVNFLKLYMVASSIGIVGLIASVVQTSLQLNVIQDLSKWETEKLALLKIACVSASLLVQIFSLTTTSSLIGNMSPPKRAS